MLNTILKPNSPCFIVDKMDKHLCFIGGVKEPVFTIYQHVNAQYKNLGLKNGDLITVEVPTNDCVYTLRCVLDSDYRYHVHRYNLIYSETEVNKIQRRKFFRVPCSIECGFALLSDNAATVEEPIMYSAMMVDISGGGAQIEYEHDIPLNIDVILRFALPLPFEEGNYNFTVFGKIKRHNKQNNKHYIGVEFISLNEYESNIIMGFAFYKKLQQNR
ncbi:flagellar brake protein [Dethiobacter alkaliphilus]|uniref:Type IV pilus assembly PilZ n=1 Tax=Dethiobacter alkaliphilus AHT 1 TaxID=555088 RepID=C0GFI0_DETAL|nr:PilZ domain-containing protein [Dethiobacter alkaliphilus]EEG77940.1 type IV pilus assembly PilZ [Dethiobacter alkaliphilus AHT 1]